MTERKWKAISRKDRPSGLAGDTGVVRWRVVEDAGPNYPAEMGVEIPMHGRAGESNAALIAAAPDLYAALSELINWSERAGCSRAFLATARAALAKANGETQ